ncbi:hypothetical protein ASD11_00560 [Aeromicrobium sp. Root495]|nr:hypothetical protein ASD11_00560 [Aeromicrobium sp. Root495]
MRALVLAAAVDVFAEKGLAGATTREIAERAGVGEPTMFRIYGSKERIFEAAVLAPFDVFIEAFTERWLAAPLPGGEPADVLAQFVSELHRLVGENRALFAAVAGTDQLGAGLQRALGRLEQVGDAIAETHDLVFDVPVAVRIAMVAVTATTLVEGSVFPEEQRGQRMLDELTRMLVGATLHRPDRTL